MQENIVKLYPNPETSAKVMDYSITKSTPLPDWLLKYHKWGCESTKVPEFLISTFQAQMLVFLARIVAAKRGIHISQPCSFCSSCPSPPPSLLESSPTGLHERRRNADGSSSD